MWKEISEKPIVLKKQGENGKKCSRWMQKWKEINDKPIVLKRQGDNYKKTQ